MKNYPFLLLILLLACRENESYPIPDFQAGAFVVAQVTPNSDTLRIGTDVPFEAAIGYQSYGYLTATSINLSLSYSASTVGPLLLRTIEAVEAPADNDLSSVPSVAVSLSEAAALFGLGSDELQDGDRFSMTFALQLEDGRTIDQWNSGFGSICDARTPGVCEISIAVSN